MRGGWIGNAGSADDGLEGKLQDKNFRFSMIKFFTSCEQSLRTIEVLLFMRILVISSQEKSRSNPRKEGLIAEFSLSTISCLRIVEGPKGISPDRTIFKDPFFLVKKGKFGFLTALDTDAAAIAHPFVVGVEIRESYTSAQCSCVGVVF